MKRIAVNGFGRIGRALLRALYARGWRQSLQPVAINDPAPADQLAALFARDSLYGLAPVSSKIKDNHLYLGEDRLHFLHFDSAADLPWRELEPDLVFECSGQLLDRQQLQPHLKAGAPRVLVSNPGTGDLDATVVFGLNQQSMTGQEQLVSGASCTSNCLAVVLSVLDRDFGLKKAGVTSLHAAMNDQPLLDTAGAPSIRLARAGGRSMVPVPTRLARGVERLMPQWQGKLMSHALRLPGTATSALDIHLWLERPADEAAVNDSLRRAAEGELKGVLGLCEEPLVSGDFLADSRSAVVDAAETTCMDDGMVRLLVWFDGEWAFACRLLETANHWLDQPCP